MNSERTGAVSPGGSAYLPLNPVIHTLDNGLRVVSEQLPYVHSASIGVWIRVGSGCETPQQAGISHFLEHLLFKGTPTRTARQIMEEVEGRGGQLNAFTTREYTCYYARVLEQHVASGFDVLADIVKNSTLNDLEKERNVILEEISMIKDVPEDYVHDLTTEQVWRGHALGRPISGYEETVGAATMESVREYRDAWYAPQNMIISIAGRFDEAEFLKQVEKEFGGLPAHALPTIENTAPEYRSGELIEPRDVAQDHLVCCFPSVSITDPRRFAYDLLSNVLGGGSTSRLFERIREQEGMAYSVYSFNSLLGTAGLMGFYAGVAPENLSKSVDLAFQELRRLREETMNVEELTSNREQIKGGLLMALEGTFNRMARLVRSLIYQGRIVAVDEVLQNLDRVTVDDVRHAANEIFTKPNTALTVLGPAPAAPLALSL